MKIPRLTSLLLISLTGSISMAADKFEYFDHNIKPIFASRCVQCHSCYNSPCQLKLTSVDGLDRGLVKGFDVFTPGKLTEAPPSRLGIDRKTTEGWRNFTNKIHFMPVTQDTGNVKNNLETSFILKLVQHKKANASLVVNDLDKPEEGSEASRICPDVPKDLASHLKSRPNAGMPYGLPALNADQIQKIKLWTEMGSPRSFVAPPIAQKDASAILQIEGFLNSFQNMKSLQEARRQSLVSRYIYEHLFLADIHLRSESAPDAFYRLIRSRSACDKADEIATRRPWDAAGVNFYYCLQRVDSMLVNKTHMPYLITEAKINRWKELFLSSAWTVNFKAEPGAVDIAPREDLQANNPFVIYRDIPSRAKYQFLLDDAQYHVMTFIKGPVCKGSTAVNSIDEQFYVLFMKPDSDLMVRNPRFVTASSPYLYLPAYKGSNQLAGVKAALQQRDTRNHYRKLRDKEYGKQFPHGYGVDDIWTGQDGSYATDPAVANPNAALTVFRHQDSASVEKGLVGATSKTVFVLDYSIFERIYYNLVVGFDVYGNAGHQVQTRLYMSYTKMEAEENFLAFLPAGVRQRMRRSWYFPSQNIVEKFDKKHGDMIAGSFPLLGLEKGNRVQMTPWNEESYDKLGPIEKLTILRNYRRELIGKFKTQLGSALVDNNQLNPDKSLNSKVQDVRIGNTETLSEFEQGLTKLSDMPALGSPWVLKMPSAAIILVESPEGPALYTLVRNKEHLNIAWLTHEKDRRNEAADTVIFYKGVLASYPNYIFHFDVKQGKAFLEAMMAIKDHATFEAWSRKFGSPRSGPGSEKFWPTSDRVHQVFQQKNPLEYGILDYNRYGSDYRYFADEVTDVFQNLPEDLRNDLKKELGGQ